MIGKQGAAAVVDASEGMRVEVSAFVDGELDADEVDRVIDALLASDDLASFWSDAHRAGDWMRSEEVIGVGDGESFLRRFSAKLAHEPEIIAAKRSARSRSRRFWVRTGLPGASVAAALVAVAWVAAPFGGDDKKVVPTVAIVPVTKADDLVVRQTGLKPVDPDRLSEYLAAHRDVTPFAYRGNAGARQASYSPAATDAGNTP
jgi:negative regulator of sigma E activity